MSLKIETYQICWTFFEVADHRDYDGRIENMQFLSKASFTNVKFSIRTLLDEAYSSWEMNVYLSTEINYFCTFLRLSRYWCKEQNLYLSIKTVNHERKSSKWHLYSRFKPEILQQSEFQNQGFSILIGLFGVISMLLLQNTMTQQIFFERNMQFLPLDKLKSWKNQ